MLRNQVQLITYPDSLDGALPGVRRFLDTYLSDAVGGVHILPFYPSSADRGFAPLTHLEVDPDFGDWDDIKEISSRYDLVADFTVNHISCLSDYFRDFIEKGDNSYYASMFLDVDTFLKRHGAELDALADTYRPRPTLPFTTFQFEDGTTRRLWTTCTDHQIDLDVHSDVTKEVMLSFIEKLSENGVNLIRLDAVGYAVKKPWTKSFLIPETYEFIGWLREVTPLHIDLLADIHHDPEKQKSLLDSGSVEWTYDFSLPLLTLHAMYSGETKNLLNWINSRPEEQITTLDTHDGIGVIDVAGLMTQEEVDATIAWVEENGANKSYRASGLSSENLDIYQINSTYYSALGEDDDAYVAARAIQFFIPGIPQVYYVGLMAGKNDYEQLAKTNHGRDINRHNYTWPEIEQAMDQEVVQRLLRLMRFRSSHPAFSGKFASLPAEEGSLHLRWDLDDIYCEARISLEKKTVTIQFVDPESREVKEESF